MITAKTDVPRVATPIVEIFSELGTPIITYKGVNLSEYITKFTYKQEQGKGGEVVVNIDIDDVSIVDTEALQEGQWILFHWGYVYSDNTYTLSPMVKVKVSDMGAKFSYNKMQISFKGKDLVQELITISPVPTSTLDLYKGEHWINIFDNGLGKKVGVVIHDTIEGRFLYANKFSKETVETNQVVYDLLDTPVGDVGNNLLTQVKQKIQALPNGPWYIDAISNMLYIHNDSPVPSPNTPTYIYGGGVNKEQVPSQEITPEELLLSFSFDIKYVTKLANTGGGYGISSGKSLIYGGSGTIPTANNTGLQNDYHYIAFRYIDPLGDYDKITSLLKKLAVEYSKGNVDDLVYAEVRDYYFNGRFNKDRKRIGKNQLDGPSINILKVKLDALVKQYRDKYKKEREEKAKEQGKANKGDTIKKSKVSQSSKGKVAEYDFNSVTSEWLTEFITREMAKYAEPIAGSFADPNGEPIVRNLFEILMGETNRAKFMQQLKKVVDTKNKVFIGYDKEKGNPLNAVTSYVTYIPVSKVLEALDANSLLASLELDANNGVGYSSYSIRNKYSSQKPRLGYKVDNNPNNMSNSYMRGRVEQAINRLNTWSNPRLYYNSNYSFFYINGRGYLQEVLVPVTVYAEQSIYVNAENFYWKAFQFLRRAKYDPGKTAEDQRFDAIQGRINNLSAAINAIGSRQSKMVRERQVTCEITCIGNPNIMVASSVNILGVGNKWSGIWGVKAIQHEISSSGYTCRMNVEKKQTNASFRVSSEVEPPVEG